MRNQRGRLLRLWDKISCLALCAYEGFCFWNDTYSLLAFAKIVCEAKCELFEILEMRPSKTCREYTKSLAEALSCCELK